MSLLAQARLASDTVFLSRITACAALERIPSPQSWVYARQWELSAQPGWAEAYATAEIDHKTSPSVFPPPGENPEAITDPMIHAAVALLHHGAAAGDDEPEDPTHNQ